MKNKLIYIFIVLIFSIGFFALGWYMHLKYNNTPNSANTSINATELSPDWWRSHYPYLTMAPEECYSGNIPDDYGCIYGLAESTLAEANMLAEELLKTSPEADNPYMHEGYYESLHKYIQLVQKNGDDFVNAFCELDGMLVYGGSGMMSEIASCRYFYAKQYLDILKVIEQDIRK